MELSHFAGGVATAKYAAGVGGSVHDELAASAVSLDDNIIVESWVYSVLSVRLIRR